MKKIVFRFSDYSHQDYEGLENIEENGKLIVIREKYKYNLEKEGRYFYLLCRFIEKLNQESKTGGLIIIDGKDKNDAASEREEEEIEEDSISYGEKINSPVMSIKVDEGKVYTKGYIGVLRGLIKYEDEDEKEEYDVTVEIGSRFDRYNDSQYFLRYMILRGYLYRVPVYEKLNPQASEDDYLWDWLLILAFKYYLEKAYRNGLFKKYRQFAYNDAKFKGVLDVNRHIKYNIPFIGNIAYNKRELTHNNEIMHLILHAYDVLKRRFKTDTDRFIERESKAYEAITAIKEVAFDYQNQNIRSLLNKCSKRITHPYYYNYEPLRRICLRILRNRGLSFFDGNSADVFGIIVDISKLWELFLEKAVLNDIKNETLYFATQYEIKLNIKGKEGLREICLRPDYVLEDKKEKKRYVLDAKYRKGWENFVVNLHSEDSRKLFENIREDYYQISTYVYLLSAVWGGAIFPYSKEEIKDPGDICLEGEGKIFYLFPLMIPREKDVIRWKEHMEKEINNTRSCISQKL
ncbi:McrBC 5-methylcytosine restriction system component [Thermosyntropha lipolytica DSM 11003]|uniref:McrBC 5-methylcytosine restriction system component n=1 Tax=Thermosyntropha lipolytica DSM 11003 TaxID=1123382 RepID=A0A1M5K5J3_9FIRM|nr:hypothetical protein [Thermosyntropha lipolytica]SHG48107.1 McrBC 5-methylcytosine restriction system component [Thermosyntropha lipolytica DSM 11003]